MSIFSKYGINVSNVIFQNVEFQTFQDRTSQLLKRFFILTKSLGRGHQS